MGKPLTARGASPLSRPVSQSEIHRSGADESKAAQRRRIGRFRSGTNSWRGHEAVQGLRIPRNEGESQTLICPARSKRGLGRTFPSRKGSAARSRRRGKACPRALLRPYRQTLLATNFACSANPASRLLATCAHPRKRLAIFPGWWPRTGIDGLGEGAWNPPLMRIHGISGSWY